MTTTQMIVLVSLSATAFVGGATGLAVLVFLKLSGRIS